MRKPLSRETKIQTGLVLLIVGFAMMSAWGGAIKESVWLTFTAAAASLYFFVKLVTRRSDIHMKAWRDWATQNGCYPFPPLDETKLSEVTRSLASVGDPKHHSLICRGTLNNREFCIATVPWDEGAGHTEQHGIREVILVRYRSQFRVTQASLTYEEMRALIGWKCLNAVVGYGWIMVYRPYDDFTPSVIEKDLAAAIRITDTYDFLLSSGLAKEKPLDAEKQRYSLLSQVKRW